MEILIERCTVHVTVKCRLLTFLEGITLLFNAEGRRPEALKSKVIPSK